MTGGLCRLFARRWRGSHGLGFADQPVPGRGQIQKARADHGVGRCRRLAQGVLGLLAVEIQPVWRHILIKHGKDAPDANRSNCLGRVRFPRGNQKREFDGRLLPRTRFITEQPCGVSVAVWVIKREASMNGIIYLVGLIVVIMAILSFVGLR